jgi:hypothetical protein
MIFAGSIWFSTQQNATSLELSQKQHESDQKIAMDQQQEEVLVNYEKDISDLLLNDKLGSSNYSDPVRVVARAKTLTALLDLGPKRKGYLVQPGVNTFQPRWKRTGEHRAVLRNRWYRITRCIGRCLEDRMVCRPDLEVLYALPAPVISFSPNSS